MSDKESMALSQKLHYGLALAEQKMLEEKAVKEEPLIEGTPNGEIKIVDAREVLDKITNTEKR